MKRLILITGGARSGKSSYALEIAESLGERRLFVATCPTLDPEMEDRVQRHKNERKGRGWSTCECEIDLSAVFENKSFQFDVILIDCLTLWINNVLYNSDKSKKIIDDIIIKRLCRSWLETAKKFSGTVICVSNEVGMGIVPENSLARKYRDLLGTCNQVIGKTADQVVLVSCGIPLQIKNL